MFIIDAHLDLATNALSLNRDLKLPVQAIRDKERFLELTDTQDRGNGTVSLPALRQGNVGLVVATIIARFSAVGRPIPSLNLVGWHSFEQAYAFAQGQLAWYRVMEDQGELTQITNLPELDAHLALWADVTIPNETKPVGYILSLEGADSIIDPSYLHRYYENGLRAIGPAHFGPGRYAAGTHSDGSGLTYPGRELLREMDNLNLILDLTHLTDKGFFEAIDLFRGTVWASHQNCRALVRGERQFSDDQLRAIIERDGVIGGALDTWMLHNDVKLGGHDSPRALGINLEKLVDHFDHICQLAGNANHIAFGTDLDGLFGLEQSPYDLDTIADLPKYESILSRRGYSQADIDKIFNGNWLRLFRRTWGK
ncbi:membrane dipeptidase [Fibrella sp. HMF5335]|uniref:Membrane dipeptidase n=1 Tax=Fibrella rubiginis TaxID=2817060 RepID=A0A939K106_9BACT|nr:membrane dipeptidase [Fibrella rubiginis]MBO0936652.1 membrane dipeptidase [Fibrella rubiginis]